MMGAGRGWSRAELVDVQAMVETAAILYDTGELISLRPLDA
jgi:hypothetical protein